MAASSGLSVGAGLHVSGPTKTTDPHVFLHYPPNNARGNPITLSYRGGEGPWRMVAWMSEDELCLADEQHCLESLLLRLRMYRTVIFYSLGQEWAT